MSNKIGLFSLLLLTLTFFSCSETEEVGKYDNWRSRNEAFIDSLQNVYETASDKGGLSRIKLVADPTKYLYYKEIQKAAEGTVGSPKYSDYVKVFYKGTNILGEYFDGNFTGNNPVIDDDDPNTGDSTPTVFQAGAVIAGWGEILQQMKIGDRFVVYIPWAYAYGSAGKGSILGYSTLIFDLTLLDYANKEADLNK